MDSCPIPHFLSLPIREIANCQYCSFALEVMAAMLVVKNKSICLLWELNSIFPLILREQFDCIDPPPQNMAALSRDCKPRRPLLLSHLKLSPDLWWIQIRQFRKICHFCKTHNYRHASFIILVNLLPNVYKFFAKLIIFLKLSFVKMPLFVISFVIGHTLELSIFAQFFSFFA